jgi:catechol 2,3-dioxygenase-like lactoylglutathione lyase family enzyme
MRSTGTGSEEPSALHVPVYRPETPTQSRKSAVSARSVALFAAVQIDYIHSVSMGTEFGSIASSRRPSHESGRPFTQHAMTSPLPLHGLHHVARLTKRLDASRAFYRDVLGFREIVRPSLRFPGAWLAGYGLQIHLIVDESINDATGSIDTRANHLAFHTDDNGAIESLLAQHGVPYRVNVQTDTGLIQVFFRDPDGHHVEVATYPPT